MHTTPPPPLPHTHTHTFLAQTKHAAEAHSLKTRAVEKAGKSESLRVEALSARDKGALVLRKAKEKTTVLQKTAAEMMAEYNDIKMTFDATHGASARPPRSHVVSLTRAHAPPYTLAHRLAQADGADGEGGGRKGRGGYKGGHRGEPQAHGEGARAVVDPACGVFWWQRNILFFSIDTLQAREVCGEKKLVFKAPILRAWW